MSSFDFRYVPHCRIFTKGNIDSSPCSGHFSRWPFIASCLNEQLPGWTPLTRAVANAVASQPQLYVPIWRSSSAASCFLAKVTLVGYVLSYISTSVLLLAPVLLIVSQWPRPFSVSLVLYEWFCHWAILLEKSATPCCTVWGWIRTYRATLFAFHEASRWACRFQYQSLVFFMLSLVKCLMMNMPCDFWFPWQCLLFTFEIIDIFSDFGPRTLLSDLG